MRPRVSALIRTVLFSGVALSIAGCGLFGGGSSSKSAGGAEVKSMVLATELTPDGQAINPRNIFAPNVPAIQAVVLLDGVAEGMKVEGKWYQLGTSDAKAEGQVVNSSSVTLGKDTVQNGLARVTFQERSGGNGLPEDSWLVRIFVNDKLVKTSGFVVTRAAGALLPPPPPAPVSATPASYTVVSGDTIASIAQKLVPQGETVANFTTRLTTLNNLTANANLSPGQVLKVPPRNP